MRSRLAKSFATSVYLWALFSSQVALAQASATKWDEKPFNYKYKFEDTVNIRHAWTEAYDFMIEASKRNNIGQGLQKLHTEQQVEDRENFQYWLPHANISKSHGTPMIANEIKTEFGFAVAKQAMESFGFLKKITRSLQFKVNLLEVKRDKEQEERQRRNFSIRPKHDDLGNTPAKQKHPQNPAGFGLAAPSEADIIRTSDEPIERQQQEKWRQMGSIEAGLKPNSNPNTLVNEDPSQSRFQFSLSQGNGFYTLQLPLGAGNVSQGLSHAFRAPVYSTLKVGRDYNHKGQAISSGLYNILMAERPYEPQLNIIYEHLEKRYGTSCSVKNRDHSELSVKTTTPAPQNITTEDLDNRGAEYTLAYATPL